MKKFAEDNMSVIDIIMEMVEMLFDFGLTERSLLDSLYRRLCCHVVVVPHLRQPKYAP